MTQISKNDRIMRGAFTAFSGADITANIYLPPVTTRKEGKGLIDNLSKGVVYNLGSIQTISISVFNAKTPMRSLGFKRPPGFARGTKTIAGTLIFNQLNQNVLDDTGRHSVLYDKKGILTYSSGSLEYVRIASENNKLNALYGKDFLKEKGIEGEDPVSLDADIKRRHVWDFSWDQSSVGRRLQAHDLPPFDIIILYANELGNFGKQILYGVELLNEQQVLSINDAYTEVIYQYQAMDYEAFEEVNFEETSKWRSVLFPDYIQARDSSAASAAELGEQTANSVRNTLLNLRSV